MAREPSSKRSRRIVRVGKYEVIAHVATGGMGAVYKAVDTDLKRTVALKILSPDLAAKPSALERFRREARHAAKLRHENIVTIYEFGNDGATWFLALEFVDGIDLAEYISRKGHLDPEETRLIALQAARALHHAHKHGIVHRDIKPSNFLACRKGDKLFVKMSDFGLAREMTDEEARVTRDGTTVGTVDYMSPEQARDSGRADIRSDIYSLGCSLYHMLTGRPPFTGGGIGERLLKHISEEPPDMRDFNPRVSDGLSAVIRRMLAKRPEDRYQTPKDLMTDLMKIQAVGVAGEERDVLAGLALSEDEAADPSDAPGPRKRPSSATRAARVPLRPSGADTLADSSAHHTSLGGQRALLLYGLAGLVALLAVIVGVLAMGSGKPRGPVDETRESVGPPPPAVDLAPRPAETGRAIGPGKPAAGALTSQNIWPLLFDQASPVAADGLWQEFLLPWANEGEPVDAIVHRVARVPLPGERAFTRLEAACAAASASRTTIVEIHDNGPLFVQPMTVSDRRLVLRAAKGFRPLLVWDAERLKKGEPASLFSAVRSRLVLEGIDVAVRWQDSTAERRTPLFRITEGDFLARDSTFSAAGKHPGGLCVVRFERGDPTAPVPSPAPRCRFSRCCLRGAHLVALDLDSPGSEVLFDGCLVMGGVPPLLDFTGRARTPVVLRLVRSTFLAGQSILRVTPAGKEDIEPQLRCQAWDTVLARGGGVSGGEMVAVAGGGRTAAMRWQPRNCLYAGWHTLIRSGNANAVDLGGWQVSWHLGPNGDSAVASPWPTVMPLDPAELLPDACRPVPAPATPIGYAATSGPGPIGHDPAALPSVRGNWMALAGESLPIPTVELLVDAGPPPVPTAADGKYHGGVVDVSRVDLGAHLDEMKRSPGLGPRVVLYLTGQGVVKTRAIRVKGSSLVLYVAPPEEGMEPLALAPHDTAPPEGDALLDVEGGNLEAIGLEIRCPDYRLALLPRYLLKVRGGDLRLLRCRLHGPRLQAPDYYRGALALEGSGNADAPRICALQETVLVSGKAGVYVSGSGARIRLRQCVLLCTGDGFSLEPGPTAPPRLGITCSLENTTVAARRSVVRLGDTPHLETPAEPVIFLAHDAAFLNPFTDKGPPPTLFALEGDALRRGLLLWQGENCAFDKRLGREVVLLAGTNAQPSTNLAWARLWGAGWERRQHLELSLTRTLDWDKPLFERLTLPTLKPPSGEMKRTPPGADLEALGLLRAQEKPRKPGT